jgi:hypothetical protein
MVSSIRSTGSSSIVAIETSLGQLAPHRRDAAAASLSVEAFAVNADNAVA